MADTGYIPDKLAQFLSRVLAWGSGYVNLHGKTPDRDKATRQFPRKGGGPVFESMNEYGSILQWIAMINRDGDDGFFCLSTRNSCVVDENGRKRASRNDKIGNLPVQLKALWLDLDVWSPGDPEELRPNKYESRDAARKAGREFLEGLGLKIGAEIDTGGGYHLYIIFDRGIDPERWQVLDRALVEAARRADIKHDLKVHERNRFLRLPTTYNHKRENDPRPVTILELGPDMVVEDVEHILAPFVGSTPGVVNSPGKARFVLDPKEFPQRPPIRGKIYDDVMASLTYGRSQTTSMEAVVGACPVVANSLKKHGAGDDQELWRTMARLCQYVQDGRRYFHELSSGWSGRNGTYTAADTDAMFDRIAGDPKSLAWPQCSHIAKLSPLCAGCEYNGKGGSPINHSFISAPAPKAYVNGHSNPAILPAVATAPIELPDKYLHLADGYIVLSADVTKRVFNWPIIGLEPSLSNNGIVFTVTRDNLRHVHERVPVNIADATSEQAMAKHAFLLPYSDLKRVKAFMVDWTTWIRQRRELHRDTRPGWVIGPDQNIENFAFGGPDYDPWLEPAGVLDKWQGVIGHYIGRGMTEIDFVVACAFGAPLMALTSEHVAIIHLNADPGYGKSLSLALTASVWGHPSHIVYQNMTENAVNERMAALNNLPLLNDEMITSARGAKGQNVATQIVHRAAGKERGRLNRVSAYNAGRESRTLVVTTGNFSMLEAVTATDSTAGVVRVIELSMRPTLIGKFDQGTAAQHKELLERNYGQAGLVYARFLAKNHALLKQMVVEAVRTFQEKTGMTSVERFWLAAAAAIFVGAKVAKHLNLVPFNTKELEQFILDTLQAQRTQKRALNIDHGSPEVCISRVIDFLNENLNGILPGSRLPTKGRLSAVDRVTEENRRARMIVARMWKDDEVLEVSWRRLQDYLIKREMTADAMRRTLKKSGACKELKDHVSLSRGSDLPNKSMQEAVLRFDLRVPANAPFRSFYELMLDEGDSDVRPAVSTGAEGVRPGQPTDLGHLPNG